MPRAIIRPDDSILVLIDVQTNFLEAIHEADRVVNRSLFLAQTARLLEVPIIATEQNPDRLGVIDPNFFSLLSQPPIRKLSFACTGEPLFIQALNQTKRSQVILVGVETHICVGLTANQLLEDGFEVIVCPDAVSSRTIERHKLGMERIRDAGAVPAHTESVAYDWLGSAEHPKFREALSIVKQHP
jgi:nicotinamidase-related amidase